MGNNSDRGEVAFKFVKLICSFVICGGALYYLIPLIFDPAVDDGTKKWLTGIIGIMIGYWVK